ncbi:LysR family transcriptional regulator [Halobacillus sp. ACCC02827]|uniref:LysR family transcriptional regulator n=1 Tax=unclassified Halobacillus TaxID=2636472 RepID=UPI000782D98A|nr:MULTISPECIES: LysR family transcriptional regulator [unclassified Halobacillus]WJE17629.1 LysR family transcriptional regulator [Halobacillus sp. ACCC02827]
MDFKQLRTFITAAEMLNFTKTAKQLNFAQSSVTAQIKALEEELGQPLFERLGRRLFLTDAGHRFKEYADQLVRIYAEAKAVVGDEQKLQRTLVIGAQESQCTYRLPPVLSAFRKHFPEVKVIFKPAHSEARVREEIRNGTLDVAVLLDQEKSADHLVTEALREEKLMVVAAADHPLSVKKKVGVDELADETFLLTESGCSYRELLEHSFHQDGYSLSNLLEFGSIEAIKQCAVAGLGLAALPEMVVEKEIREGRLVELPWTKDMPPLYTQIAWHKEKWMSVPLSGFIDLTRKIYCTS